MRVMMLSHNKTNDKINIKDCQYRGVFRTSYDKLVKVFGEPLEGDKYNTEVEWHINLTINEKDSYPVRIYNYRNGKSSLGKDGLAVEDITAWSVDSKDLNVMPILKKRRALKIK